jgi:hypothetical protein
MLCYITHAVENVCVNNLHSSYSVKINILLVLMTCFLNGNVNAKDCGILVIKQLPYKEVFWDILELK